MELYLIRHGQGDNNIPGWIRTPQYSDAHLTELGHKQAQATGAFLKSQDISVLYCSPLVRCLETAGHISDAIGLQPHVWGHMYEIATEEYYASPMHAIAEMFPHVRVPRSAEEAGWWDGDVDTDEKLVQRANHTIQQLVHHHGSDSGRIAVVAHGGYNSVLLSVILGLPVSTYQRFAQYNTCINRINLTADRVQIVTINDTAHLPQELQEEFNRKKQQQFSA